MPSVGVMTTKFVSAAELMARVLGADGYEFAVTDHPFSSASNEELARRAKQVVEQSTNLLLQSQS